LACYFGIDHLVVVKNLNAISKKIAAEDALALFDKLIGDAFQLDSVWSNGYRSEPGALPELLVTDLRNREVEPRAQPPHRFAHNHPLFLQRLAMGKVDFQGTEYDGHRSSNVAGVPDSN